MMNESSSIPPRPGDEPEIGRTPDGAEPASPRVNSAGGHQSAQERGGAPAQRAPQLGAHDASGQRPGAGYPGEAHPGAQYPGSQYPHTQYPHAQYPGAEYPHTQYPNTQYGQFAANAAASPAKKPRRRRRAGLAIAGSVVAAAVVGFGTGYFVQPSHITVQVGAEAAPNSQGATGQGSTGQGSTGQGSTGQGSTGQGSTGQDPQGGQYGSGSQNGYGQNGYGGQYGSGGENGYGQNGYGSQNGDTSNGQTSTGTSSATKAQAKGIVEINTVLKYQGAEAAGTGMILTPNGEILTNNHVVEGSTSIKATVSTTGKTYKARVVGTDKKDDVAVLKLTGASHLKTVEPDTGKVSLHEKVVGIGNAGGTGTLTAATGKVTALNQQITTMSEGAADSETLDGLIQTSADVQAGDSGGPLVDSDGEVIGMDTAAATNSQTGTSSSGYAIPIKSALSIAKTIEAGQETNTVSIGYPAFLGIELSNSSRQTANGSRVNGAVVAGVIPGTPAASAGLQAGDVITRVGNTPTGSATKLSTVLDGYEPGQSATIHWTDSAGATHQATVTLMNGPVE